LISCFRFLDHPFPRQGAPGPDPNQEPSPFSHQKAAVTITGGKAMELYFSSFIGGLIGTGLMDLAGFLLEKLKVTSGSG
jgi:hypothetical protein